MKNPFAETIEAIAFSTDDTIQRAQEFTSELSDDYAKFGSTFADIDVKVEDLEEAAYLLSLSIIDPEVWVEKTDENHRVSFFRFVAGNFVLRFWLADDTAKELSSYQVAIIQPYGSPVYKCLAQAIHEITGEIPF